MSVIYSARGISKRFGAVHALSDVDFDVVEGKGQRTGRRQWRRQVHIVEDHRRRAAARRRRPEARRPPAGDACDHRRSARRHCDGLAGIEPVPGADRGRESPAWRRAAAPGKRAAPSAAAPTPSSNSSACTSSLRMPLHRLTSGGPAIGRNRSRAYCKIRVSLFSTSRRRRCMSPRSNVSTRSFAACAIPASASSMSAISSRNCWRYPTIWSFSATASEFRRTSRRQPIS